MFMYSAFILINRRLIGALQILIDDDDD